MNDSLRIGLGLIFGSFLVTVVMFVLLMTALTALDKRRKR